MSKDLYTPRSLYFIEMRQTSMLEELEEITKIVRRNNKKNNKNFRLGKVPCVFILVSYQKAPKKSSVVKENA